MMRLYFVIGIVGAYLFVAACSSEESDWAHNLKQALEQQGHFKSEGTYIRLQDFTSWQWDRVYLFPPYSNRGIIDSTLGANIPDQVTLTIHRSDGVNLVVFEAPSQEFMFFEISRSLIDFELAGQVVELDNTDARFIVHWRQDKGLLLRMQGAENGSDSGAGGGNGTGPVPDEQ